MDQSWKTHIIFLVLINFCVLISCSPLDGDDSLNFSDDIVYPAIDEQNEIAKRLSSFVRIGRGLSSFIRIGRSDPEFSIYEAVPGEDDGEDNGEFQKRKSAFVRIGRGGEPEADTTLSSWRSGYGTEPLSQSFNKRGGAFIRLGKFPSAGFVRNRSGRIHSISSPPYYRRSGRIGHSSFIRIGKRDTRNALKQMGIQNMNEEELRRYLEQREADNLNGGDNAIADAGKEPTAKRISSFVRIGRQMGAGYNPYENRHYNRHTSRTTKTNDNTNNADGQTDKRMSSFVRIGRQQDGRQNPYELQYLRNRHNSRTTNDNNSQNTASQNTDSQNTDKRMSSFVRIGKNFEGYGNADKRMSSFVRIGKSDLNDQNNAEEKRMSKFVRIGRPHLRDFKHLMRQNENDQTDTNSDEDSSLEDLAQNDKRMSKFVRIGKDHFLNLNTMTDSDSDNDLHPDEDLAQNDKRMSKFVRIGRPYYVNLDHLTKTPGNFRTQQNDQDNGIPANGFASNEKRFSKFVRIGKNVNIPNDFVKETAPEADNPYDSFEEKTGEDNAVDVIDPVNESSEDLVKVTDEN